MERTRVRIHVAAAPSDSTVEIGGVDISSIVRTLTVTQGIARTPEQSLARVSLDLLPLDLDVSVAEDVYVQATIEQTPNG